MILKIIFKICKAHVKGGCFLETFSLRVSKRNMTKNGKIKATRSRLGDILVKHLNRYGQVQRMGEYIFPKQI